MNSLINLLTKTRLLKGELDYHLVRASMVIIYFFFGYQKWFDYEAQGLIPFFTHGPLIFWMYPVFWIKGSSYFLGVSREASDKSHRATGQHPGSQHVRAAEGGRY
jgi:uncharacterized membrane protein YkgB